MALEKPGRTSSLGYKAW